MAEYLNQQESVHRFFSSAASLVDGSLAAYRRRGFTSLMVSFGCTGGQHRSVYFAERLARHVRERHPDLRVRLEHGERTRWPVADYASATELPQPPAGTADPALSIKTRPWTR